MRGFASYPLTCWHLCLFSFGFCFILVSKHYTISVGLRGNSLASVSDVDSTFNQMGVGHYMDMVEGNEILQSPVRTIFKFQPTDGTENSSPAYIKKLKIKLKHMKLKDKDWNLNWEDYPSMLKIVSLLIS